MLPVHYRSLTTQGPTLFKGECIPWDKAKKTCFPNKYGNVAQLLFIKMNDTLLKALVHFWDPTYRCFTFNEMDMVRQFSRTLSKSNGITYRYGESNIKR
ncbi:hypothetical protein Goshw_011033 [Gossypium schwendimanii]|uniref:DUF7745 domain-containing protein n=1 Tax=Gossypium schwendimanii TaxID=34291 RepID=A0A7J9MBN5_GOSSC|nr:hypothetical protein [Gossypium schwendimanii]